MSYGFDETTNQGSSNVMNPGINENVSLVDVRYEAAKSDGTGSMVLRFNFQNAEGSKFSHVEFPIEEARVRDSARQYGKDPEEYLQQRFVAQSERIFHILTLFVPREILIQRVGKTSNFEAFCAALISSLGDSNVGKLIRIKIVLNNKDYLTFPTRAIKPFAQLMSESNRLAVDLKWERIVPKAPDKEADMGDWVSSPSTAASVDSEWD